MQTRNHVTGLALLAIATALPSVGRPLHGDETLPQRKISPYFAFCFDTHDAQKRDLAQQADMLKRLGFDGAGHVGLDNIRERLATLDAAGLKLFLAGIVIDLSKPQDAALAQLQDVFPLWKERNVLLYVVLTGLPTADPQGEEIAVKTLRTIADLAQKSNVRIGVYPHTGDWVARVDHATKVVAQVDKANCGVIFNLCHFLRNEDLADLDATLKAASPHLFAVTINGADPAGKSDNDWRRLIQPLDDGSFDVGGFLARLRELDYAGPVGLMCYGIGGDAEDHLKRSIAQWRKLNDK